LGTALVNPLYGGEIIWNRVSMVRKLIDCVTSSPTATGITISTYKVARMQ
jgi:hypothetical protein